MRNQAVSVLAATLFAMLGCNSSKPTAHPDGSDAPIEHVDNDSVDLAPSSEGRDGRNVAEGADAAAESDSVDLASSSDGTDVKNVAEGSDAADASDADADVSHCIGEGQRTYNTFGADCCAGLRYIPSGSGPPVFGESQPNCSIGLDLPGVCSRCGDGVCQDWERPCGCPQDCGPVCGDKQCPVGTYCRQQRPGADGGTISYQCIDVATDCDGGTFSCFCGSLKNCLFGCDSSRWIARCGGP